ncbi:50S ribosomal protein L15 [Candidatus Saccharibacteria bacterium]|nr:50S ribosomal protein L15 [Candidatus Saccharibacteria bacterium]
MKIHELTTTSATDRKRVGRGIGSGTGKTSGRGTKGQNSRTGGGVRPGFAGGQNPLAKLLPKKRGFNALSPTIFAVVNLDQLNRFKDGDVVTPASLIALGLVKKVNVPVKLLAQGEVKTKLTIQLQAVSASAKAAIEAAGGTVEVTPLPRVHSKKATRPVATTEATTK